MSRSLFAAVLAVAAGGPSLCWSQAVSQDSNAQPSLGTPNLSVGSSETNPTLGTSRGTFEEQRNNENQSAAGGAAPSSAFQDDRAFDRVGTVDPAQPEDWRMVLHNGRWWYWTPNNSWLYYNRDRWAAYVPRGPQYDGSAAVDSRRRYQAGYRGDAQLEGDAGVQTNAGLRAGTGQPLGQTQIDPRTGLRTNMSANANTPGFEATRPIAPTANELQGFYQQQGLRATPYGGTMGGARNATPLGGGATRSGTGATGPATFGTPQTNVPGASPITNSPGNPGAIGSPGNPAAAGGTGRAGTATGAGGTTPAGGAGGTSGAGGTGASGGAGGTGS